MQRLQYPDIPGSVADSDTSEKAAKKVRPRARTVREQVLAVIVRAKNYGATCEEVEDELRYPHQTVSARIRELALDGLIEDSGDRRPTRGATARVYVACADRGS